MHVTDFKISNYWYKFFKDYRFQNIKILMVSGILQLVSHSKVLAEMVNLHFLLLMEALMECNSSVLGKLLPLWTPVFFAYNTQLPDHVRVRLQVIHFF